MARHVLVAGGGTAGHVEPALAVADAIRRLDDSVQVSVLGTAQGLEAKLVPARGYALLTIPRVPLPRRPSIEIFTVPSRLMGAVRAAGEAIDAIDAAVVVGFGGYVALPAYLAARKRKVPIVVHEANVKPGIANRVGARMATRVASAFPDSGLPHAEVVGMPLRRSLTTLDRMANRSTARISLGLDPQRPTLLVFGGSQGAASLNRVVPASSAEIVEAGGQILIAAGVGRSEEISLPAVARAHVHVVEYLDRMDLAYSAADLAITRAGAMTCAELAAVGLPAVYVPLAVGNGEQRLNARVTVESGGGILVEDADFTIDWFRSHVVPLFTDASRLAAMAEAALAGGRGLHRDADQRMAAIVLAAGRLST